MSDFIDRYRSKPAVFAGESWLIQNIINYNKELAKCVDYSGRRDKKPDIFGIPVGGFGARDWFSDEGGLLVPSAKKYLSSLSNELIEAINSSETQLLIDMSIEGYDMNTAEPFILALHQEMDLLGLHPGKCNFLSQNLNFSGEYSLFCKKKGINNSMRVYNYDYCPRKFLGQETWGKDDENLEINIRRYELSLEQSLNHYFLCLNFTPRPARIGFVSWLFGKGLNGHGEISFRGVGQRKDGVYQSALDAPSWFPQQDFVKAGITHLNGATLNLDLDSELDGALAKEPVFSSASDAVYQNTGFSLVTETDVHDGGILRITEKSLKPIAKLHPFMILGNPGSLEILRTLGFQTFSPFIDEEYDRVHTANERIISLMQEFERIVRLPQSSFDQWRRDLSTRVVFNYEHFMHRLPGIYCNKELEILNAMHS